MKWAHWSVLCWFGFVCAARAAETTGAASDFEKVCEALRSATLVEAEFEEEKTLQILSRSLQSKGHLVFSPRLGVYRVIDMPLHQEILINRSEFVTRNAQGAVERMSVNSQPAARVFVDIFLSFFSGDRSAWEKTFDVQFTGELAHWRIEFVPKRGHPVSKGVRRMVLEGKEGVLDIMTLTESNGDATRTVYKNQRVFRGSEGEEAARRFFLTTETL